MPCEAQTDRSQRVIPTALTISMMHAVISSQSAARPIRNNLVFDNRRKDNQLNFGDDWGAVKRQKLCRTAQICETMRFGLKNKRTGTA